MDLLKWTEKLMSMDEQTWSRHANPWSVYSRFTTLPLISLAFWSREWIAGYSIAAVALACFWVWLNPRLFSIPRSTNNWASMGTFGERIYLNRQHEQIALHHLRTCKTLQLLSAIGIPILVYGLYQLNFLAVVLGNFWIMVFKAWFVDRMVWVYMDLKDSNPIYHAWLKR